MVNLANYKEEITNAKESSRASQVPSGNYVVVLIETQEKQNSKQNGHYIQNDYEIQEGEFVGEKLIDRINHDNPNETARNIAFSTLKKLGKAIGIEPLTDTSQLLGKRIIAKVKNEASDRAILDDNGQQRLDDNGKPLFYRNINITDYQPYTAGGGNQPSAEPATSGSTFPFPQ
ncbi:MAG: hypothetical protein Unbinned5081contig1002_29 [Prokaryotic dsDNA virus sp.]|nr:MAG: hypothetical protein Unbinned5081contig1002_29 [Prokaryotic dsDNA virus sp.]|tara:strand:- start:33424 stop:33945 length:522 start_codon:yes stop_codon:yes gene_type:complete